MPTDATSHDSAAVTIEAIDKATAHAVAQLTLAEKIAYLCAEHPAIERLDYPAYRLEAEGAHGLVIRAGQSGFTENAQTTVFPQTFGLSMTWDRDLLYRIGQVISDEARAFNVLVLFSPTIDLARDPRWGRNEEAYGEDPYLVGQLGVQYIRGLQGDRFPYLKTVATVKHFYANNYEFERDWDDSVLPEQLQRDYYLRPFEYAFRDGKAASAMTSYNMVNGAIGMTNPELNSILRDEWSASGYFVSDGGAPELLTEMYGRYPGTKDPQTSLAHYLGKSLEAGLDCFLAYNDDQVINAVQRGLELGVITEPMIDRALTRQFKTMLRLGLVPGAPDTPFADIGKDRLLTAESAELVRRAAKEAVVLLKNDDFLPLDASKTKKLAVIGQLGDENLRDWYSGYPPHEVTPVDGLRNEFPDAEIVFDDGCDRVLLYNDATERWARVDKTGTVTFDGTETDRAVFRVLDWGYGFAFCDEATGKYLATTETGELKANSAEIWGWFTRELFFLNKPNPYQQTGVPTYPTGITGVSITDDPKIDGARFAPVTPFGVAAQPFGAEKPGKNQYLVPFEPAGAEQLNRTLEHLTVQVVDDGLVRAAQTAEDADAVFVVLGNHPLVGARECVDRPSLALPARWTALFNATANANENVALVMIAGYQYAICALEEKSRAAIFTSHGLQEVGSAIAETISGKNNPAGRLSQTWYADDFEFGSLRNYDIRETKLTYLYTDQKPLHEFGFGLSYTQFEYAGLELTETGAGVTVSFLVTNTGRRSGAEVPQVYFVPGRSGGPHKALVGFDRIDLAAGETKTVSVAVPFRELSFWDITAGQYLFTPGIFRFEVGASSADIRLTGEIELATPANERREQAA